MARERRSVAVHELLGDLPELLRVNRLRLEGRGKLGVARGRSAEAEVVVAPRDAVGAAAARRRHALGRHDDDLVGAARADLLACRS